MWDAMAKKFMEERPGFRGRQRDLAKIILNMATKMQRLAAAQEQKEAWLERYWFYKHSEEAQRQIEGGIRDELGHGRKGWNPQQGYN